MKLTQAYLNYQEKVNKVLENDSNLLIKLMNTKDEDFIPKKKHKSDAGYDCRARIDEPLRLKPGQRVCIPLGFAINIPLYHTGDLRPRSGMTRDYGIMVGYGTIDAGYTGEVMATIFNFGEEDFTIHPKDRIAQLVILPTVKGSDDHHVKLQKVDKLVELERGDKGHGSSGIK